MGKKPFINKKEARHFQVVHRSQRDPKFHSDDATPYVLKPIVPSPNLLKKGGADHTQDDNDDLPEDVIDRGEYDDSDEYYSDEDYSDYSDEEHHEGQHQGEDGGNGVFDDLTDDEQGTPSSSDAKTVRTSRPPEQGADDDMEDSRAGRAALFGIFFDDREYDYLQHLKPMGAPGSVFMAAPERKQPQSSRTRGIKFHEDLPADAQASKTELDLDPLAMVSADGGIGLGVDLPEDLREVLYALEDDAYVEDDDRYFDNLAKEDLDEDLAELVLQAEEKKRKEDELPDVIDWTMAAKVRGMNLGGGAGSSDGEFEGSDSEDETEVSEEVLALRARNASKRKRINLNDDLESMSSMSSSILSRTSHLELLDDRFDQVERQYDDEELGAIEVEAPPEFSKEQAEYVESLLDEFLHKTHVTSHNTPYENLRVQGGGVGQYDVIREMMRTDEEGNPLPKIDLSKYAMEEVKPVDDADMPKLHIIEDKYENKWDCESIISTYSNLENHPTVISERGRARRKREQKAAAEAAAAAAAASSASGKADSSSSPSSPAPSTPASDPTSVKDLVAADLAALANAPQIQLSSRTGLPKSALARSALAQQNDARSDEDSDEESEEEMVEVVNLGVARSKFEDRDEKRARKQAIKEAKREKRAAKKGLKQAFKDEAIKQQKEAVVRKNQAKSVLL
ncbi:Low temperature viability protein-domain-containing protein [Catenaria anguillulae PL171]|uniref:Low temperature viability protein-domain-containing protein n=1 Tax=Catenaria anguillulae PL171 TaxID=765915 RepID=A0A1Y2I2P5_9FUNG|nr:Low temperature viability protein-domain-containing protein [Catenaria anguillulae PL171]